MSLIVWSSAAKCRYGPSWAVESRSHIAGMSPVSMKSVPSGIVRSVVPRVFSKQRSNMAVVASSVRSRTRSTTDRMKAEWV